VQFFGFTFEDDIAFYRLNVDPDWQPEVHFEETTEPDLNEAVTAIKNRVPDIKLTIIGVYNPDDASPNLYYMVAVASSINGRVSRILSREQLDRVAKAAHLIPGTACWMRSWSTLSELRDLDIQPL
jgi:hypothetical protein